MDKRIKNSGKITHGFGSKRFSGEKHKFYDLYCGMVARCRRSTHSSYKNYGGRGIKCLWKNFEEFKNDMYESYLQHIEEYGKKDTSLDRIDVNGNYCKENCRWATRSQQATNTRISLRALVDGIEYTTRDISDICGIGIDGAGDRIKLFNKGEITKEQLLLKGHLKKKTGKGPKKITIEGTEYTSRKIADLCGISLGTASQRINRYLEGTSGKESLLAVGNQWIKQYLVK